MFLPPEGVMCGKLSDRGDVWSLGIILLMCMSLEFSFDSDLITIQSMIDTFNEVKGASLVQLQKNESERGTADKAVDYEDNLSISTSKRTEKQALEPNDLYGNTMRQVTNHANSM